MVPAECLKGKLNSHSKANYVIPQLILNSILLMLNIIVEPFSVHVPITSQPCCMGIGLKEKLMRFL